MTKSVTFLYDGLKMCSPWLQYLENPVTFPNYCKTYWPFDSWSFLLHAKL